MSAEAIPHQPFAAETSYLTGLENPEGITFEIPSDAPEGHRRIVETIYQIDGPLTGRVADVRATLDDIQERMDKHTDRLHDLAKARANPQRQVDQGLERIEGWRAEIAALQAEAAELSIQTDTLSRDNDIDQHELYTLQPLLAELAHAASVAERLDQLNNTVPAGEAYDRAYAEMFTEKDRAAGPYGVEEKIEHRALDRKAGELRLAIHQRTQKIRELARQHGRLDSMVETIKGAIDEQNTSLSFPNRKLQEIDEEVMQIISEKDEISQILMIIFEYQPAESLPPLDVEVPHEASIPPQEPHEQPLERAVLIDEQELKNGHLTVSAARHAASHGRRGLFGRKRK